MKYINYLEWMRTDGRTAGGAMKCLTWYRRFNLILDYASAVTSYGPRNVCCPFRLIGFLVFKIHLRNVFGITQNQVFSDFQSKNKKSILNETTFYMSIYEREWSEGEKSHMYAIVPKTINRGQLRRIRAIRRK